MPRDRATVLWKAPDKESDPIQLAQHCKHLCPSLTPGNPRRRWKDLDGAFQLLTWLLFYKQGAQVRGQNVGITKTMRVVISATLLFGRTSPVFLDPSFWTPCSAGPHHQDGMKTVSRPCFPRWMDPSRVLRCWNGSRGIKESFFPPPWLKKLLRILSSDFQGCMFSLI